MIVNQRNSLTYVLPADGRRIGYAEYGDPSGFPVFVFHGTPGSRLLFLDDDPVAVSLGVRIIAPERPGYGLSDPAPNRTLLSWAEDVAALADHLSIDRFAVAGSSGGGPHVAACAYALPERVVAAALISSAAPLDAPGAMLGMARANRVGLLLSRHAPWLMHLAARVQRRVITRSPQKFLRVWEEQSCEADRRVMQDPELRVLMIVHLQEALRTGALGTLHDTRLLSQPWGFDPREIRVPVHLWHGEDDTLAPIAMARYLAGAIPSCRAHFLEATGHLIAEQESVWRAILEGLLREATTAREFPD